MQIDFNNLSVLLKDTYLSTSVLDGNKTISVLNDITDIINNTIILSGYDIHDNYYEISAIGTFKIEEKPVPTKDYEFHYDQTSKELLIVGDNIDENNVIVDEELDADGKLYIETT